MAHSIARPKGVLYIVATPIGNQDDITERALHTLKTVDLIAAEDTRHSGPFLATLGVKTPLKAFHLHNEAHASERLIAELLKGRNIALISDAGTPLISDPGYPLVTKARAAEIEVIPIPGACALITALSAAGVPTDVFTFAGFLPATKSARIRKLQQFKAQKETLVFYESTHRLTAALDDIATVFGEKTSLVLAKELTKTFEAFAHGDVPYVLSWLNEDAARIKGEFVLILPPREVIEDMMEGMRCMRILQEELPLKKAAKLAASITGMSRNALYAAALEEKS